MMDQGKQPEAGQTLTRAAALAGAAAIGAGAALLGSGPRPALAGGAPIPLFIAAGGPKSARLSGMYGDGLVADPMQLMTNPAYKQAWREGALAAGKNPDTMPVLIEHFVVVGDQLSAQNPAELWRFTAKSWKPGYFNNINPAAIQARADAEIPLPMVYAQWPVSTDPMVHIQSIQKLVNMGVTHVFVHSGQRGQQLEVVDFYGRYVLPQVRGGAVTGVRPNTGY